MCFVLQIDCIVPFQTCGFHTQVFTSLLDLHTGTGKLSTEDGRAAYQVEAPASASHTQTIWSICVFTDHRHDHHDHDHHRHDSDYQIQYHLPLLELDLGLVELGCGIHCSVLRFRCGVRAASTPMRWHSGLRCSKGIGEGTRIRCRGPFPSLRSLHGAQANAMGHCTNV